MVPENPLTYEDNKYEMTSEDWDCYKINDNIRSVGDFIFKDLLSKVHHKDNASKLTKNAWYFVGLPYCKTAMRGLVNYLAQKAVKSGYIFLVAPIMKYTGDTMEMVIEDYEFALVPIDPEFLYISR